jgi:hypothetical protein
VYARDVDGQTLTLVVSGMLWQSSLVMMDQETRSLWSHLLGEAKRGPLKGKRLEQIPSVMTDWESWRKEHPDGSVVVLDRTHGAYTREFYARPERFVLGVVVDGQAKAWPFDLLQQTPARNDPVSGRPVLVAFDRTSVTARLYDRRFQERVLTFQMEGGKLTDQQTGSTWEPVSGRAVAGPLKGKYLTPLPAIVSYRKVWRAFHPQSELVSK